MRIPGFATRNFRLKLLATMLALVTWAGVVYAANPPGIRTVTVLVPQDGANLPAGFVLVRHIPDVALRVAGTQDHLNAFNVSSLILRAHYNAITQPGTLQLPIDIHNNDPNVELDSPPSSVEVVVDRLDTQTVSVRINIDPGPPPGYVTSTVVATPDKATVTGPHHELVGLQLRANVNLGNKKANVEEDVGLFSYDGAGNKLSDVNANPPVVRVLITIAAVTTERASAVLPPVRGLVADGFRLAGISVNPPTLTLTGSQDVLNSLDTVNTDPVDISGLTATKTFRVAVKTPAGVSAAPNQVSVTVSVASLTTATPTPTRTPAPT